MCLSISSGLCFLWKSEELSLGRRLLLLAVDMVLLLAEVDCIMGEYCDYYRGY